MSSVVAAVVLLLRPDEAGAVVGLITALAVASGLLLAAGFELGSCWCGRPLGALRSVMLAIPGALLVAALATLQSMRLVGPLTVATGIAIVLLADYVLWPREEP